MQQAHQAEIGKVVEQQQQTALILERVLGRLDAVERWQQNEDRAKERAEERRDDRIEKAPDTVRNVFSVYGGCIGQIVFAGLSGLGVLISIAALIITLTR